MLFHNFDRFLSEYKRRFEWAGIFHRIPRLDDARLAVIFAGDVPRFLVNKGLLSRHLELALAAEKPPPAHVFEQVALMAAEESGDYE